MNESMGFLPDKEKADSTEEDYFLGGVGKDIAGMADDVAGIGAALFAWPNPINGVYPRVDYRLNHASMLINEKAKAYLPKGVVQRGTQDWMTCTSNSPCNDLEIQFNFLIKNKLISTGNYAWLVLEGYINPDNGLFELADAYSAIGSNTTRRGNSLKAPMEWIRKHGVVPKSKMPDSKSMDWTAYHDKNRLIPELLRLGEEFLKRFPIGYEKVPRSKFSVFTQGLTWHDFDSYVDPVDGDFIKTLAPNYLLMNYGYHITINELPRKEIINNDEDMTFYKTPDGKVYQNGRGSGKLHHIMDEPTFRDLYGKFSDNEFEDIPELPAERIGRPVGQPSSFMSLIKRLLGGK